MRQTRREAQARVVSRRATQVPSHILQIVHDLLEQRKSNDFSWLIQPALTSSSSVPAAEI